MSPRRHKPKQSNWKRDLSKLKKYENMLKFLGAIVALLSGTFAVVTYLSGNRTSLYFIILLITFLIALVLIRYMRQKAIAVGIASLIVIASIGWIIYDYQTKDFLFQPAKPDELLVIVGKFDQRGGAGLDPTTRIIERLNTEFQNAKIKNVRVEPANSNNAPLIRDKETARRIGELHRAVFVIWGWYDNAGFNPTFAITRESEQPLENVELKEVPVELKDFNLYVRDGLPSQMAYFATFTLGQMYYWDKQYNQALDALQTALDNIERARRVGGVQPPDGLGSLYFYRGRIQRVFKKNLDEAIANYTKAIEFDPKEASAYNNRGNAYRDQGNVNHAIVDLTKAIDLAPESAIPYNNRGNAYTDEGNVDQGIADFSKAIELAPNLAVVYFNRGTTYYRDRRDFDLAITDLSKAIELDPKMADAYDNRGNVYRDKGDLNQAIRDFTKAIELNPISLAAYNNRGIAYIFQKKPDQAIADFSEAIKLGPKNAVTYVNRGGAYVGKDNLDQAIADYTKAIQLNEKFAFAYHGRGNAFRQMGLNSQAIADFEKYLQLSPNASGRTQVEQWLRELKGQ